MTQAWREEHTVYSGGWIRSPRGIGYTRFRNGVWEWAYWPWPASNEQAVA